MEDKKTLKIGSQTIDLEAVKSMDAGQLIKLLEGLYFDGYQQGMKSNPEKAMNDGLYKHQYERSQKDGEGEQKEEAKTEQKEEQHILVEKEEVRIEISSILQSGPKDPLEERMQEISEMVYKFKKPGFVIYRLNGLDEEYLKTKYGFTHLPMKALVFDTKEEAESYKENYWGAGYKELQIKQV
jgi:hypothetical protein